MFLISLLLVSSIAIALFTEKEPLNINQAELVAIPAIARQVK